MIGLVWWTVAAPAWSQVYVAPRRPGQSLVRTSRQDWQTLDIVQDFSRDGEEAGGVRLFYYSSEAETAERAAAQIDEAYRELAEAFDFVPKKRFDYVLYATYQEFLKTNLFPLQEGVLGVTATQGLHMAIPYFGDHDTFRHTSTHELAHEFMLQKVRAAGRATKTWRDPLEAFPLWFVEGLAEYRAMGPIDGENALRVRDLVTNPDMYQGYGLLSFWDDWPGYTLWTYQAGHARITFLEEVYGEGTLNKIMDLSPAMVSEQGLAAKIKGLGDLVESITGDDRRRVAERFDQWIKDRTYREWLAATQTPAEFEALEDVVGVPLALDASPDGNLVAYRSIAPDTGRSQLWVTDRRAKSNGWRVVADGKPGIESIHPIDPRNFDVLADRIVYVAESRGRDRIVVQAFEHEAAVAPPTPPPPDEKPFPLEITPADHPRWRVRLRPGERTEIRLDAAGIVAAGSLAVSPDGDQIAVIGLTGDGQRDIWIVTPGDDPRHPDLRRATDDVWAERDLAWGPGGIVFSSDAAADGSRQIFRLDAGGPVALTSGPGDHVSPAVLADGTVVYSALDGARSQIYALRPEGAVRLTDLAVGAFEPAPGPDGGVWSLVQHRGRYRPSLLPASAQRALEVPPGELKAPEPIAEASLAGSEPYQALAARNWGLDGGFAVIGASAGGVYGQVYLSFADRLRDHGLIVLAQAYGQPELTDAQVVYLDDHRRITWGWGAFHSLRFRVDHTVPQADFVFQSAERYYGALASLRYPLNRFVYVQTDVSAGGVSYLLPFGIDDFLADPEANGSGTDLLSVWEAANPSPRFQTEGTLRLGVDTIRYHPKTGPVAGTSFLLEGTLGVQPFDDQRMTSARVDVQQYFPVPLVSGGNLGLRAAAGTAGGGPYAIGYWLSSYDTLRAYNWGDPALLGNHYWFGNAELQLPLDGIVRLALASGIEGVVGVDFGAVSDDLTELWDKRVLDVAVGSNFILGPLVLRLHFARALDIGAPLPDTAAPWVTNFSLTWLGN